MGQEERVSHVEKMLQKPQLLPGLGAGARDMGVPLEVTVTPRKVVTTEMAMEST